MGASKEQFHRANKELKDFWNTIASSDNWKAIQVYARGELMELGLSPDAHMGAMRMLHILSTLAHGEDEVFHWPSSGLTHIKEHPKTKSIFDLEPEKKAS